MFMLILLGSILIVCYRKYKFFWVNKIVICLMGFGKIWEMEKKFNGENFGLMSCDVRFGIIVVCENFKVFDDRSKIVYVYKFW